MNTRSLAVPLGVLLVIIAAAAVLILLPGKENTPAPETSTPLGIPDLIALENPRSGASVASPLTVEGRARGGWYFEATFPIEIRDARGALIAQHYAEAQSDWMTEEFVPFTGSITYPAQPAGSRGTLVVRNANPSGDPEREQYVEVPVVFR